MPGYDGTGPWNAGPLTGHGRGYCIVKIPSGETMAVAVRESLERQYNNQKTFTEVIDMPGGDRTGPRGMGQMTGRAAGYCTGNSVPGYMTPARGMGNGARGMGGGRGGGRGWRNWFRATGMTGWQRANSGMQAFGTPVAAPTITSDQELAALKEQAGYYKSSLEGINKRIDELESKTGK